VFIGIEVSFTTGSNIVLNIALTVPEGGEFNFVFASVVEIIIR
jgi:hypothetical protein